MKIKSFECPEIYEKNMKNVLGTSDAWSTSHLSHRPSKQAYFILDCFSPNDVGAQQRNQVDIGIDL